MKIKTLIILSIALFSFSCGQKEIQIADLSETKVGNHSANELSHFLGKMYHGATFSTTTSKDAQIQFLSNEEAKKLGIANLPTKKESFKIVLNEGRLLIIAPDERGLLNGTYALLEKQGCGFSITGDVIPESKKWTGFHGWEMEDAPLTGDRFLFNWHNFLSGCTGWNQEDWQLWIDQANKMRYNGIMVHAYGNNPMFSFEYLGEKKQTGYLNNTASGRDWGNQHVNDVRRMAGGEIFNAPVFGAQVSFASEGNREKEATGLMRQVFQYAEDRGTKITFALDFDTWMSNPQNIIGKLPKDAVFESIGGYLIPNPDHPEGYKYFKQVVKTLVETYPQIDQLCVWHRRPEKKPSVGSIWMSFPYGKFPEQWKLEYRQKLKAHPEWEDNLMASGTYAYGKLIAAIQKARDEIKPELEITSGSWCFEYIPYADVMYPKDVPILPLDWEVVFNTPESKKIVADAGKNREVYPVIWAHHDDHRYIGRPYTPWENLSDMLEERNSKGFGIIHWTTRPLDLYFTSSSRQVWQSTANEPLKTTVENFVATNFEKDGGKLAGYFSDWITNGPMFGRETDDHFVDLGKQNEGPKLESWVGMKIQAEKRRKLLSEISSTNENAYLQYQKAMEEFYISFFENQILFEDAYEHARIGEMEKARQSLAKAGPDLTIRKYVDATKLVGFTPGEKAIVFSMNTRWKPDFINLRQRLGMEPVRFKFAPTRHDPLAQAPGHFTYFIDDEKVWWRCFWEHEMDNEVFTKTGNRSALVVPKEFSLPLTSMHGQALPNGNYEIQINTILPVNQEEIRLDCNQTENNRTIPASGVRFGENTIVFKVSISGKTELRIHMGNSELQIESLVIAAM